MFLYGFAKNERDNIRADELQTLRQNGAAIVLASPADLTRAIEEGRVEEIDYD